MKKVNILIFEDSSAKAESFRELLELKLNNELNLGLKLKVREDETFIESDLMTTNFDLILVDDDLGNDLWGDFIIDKIMTEVDSNPDVQNTRFVYYSAGTDLNKLKEKTRKWGHINHCTYEDLEDAVMKLIESSLVA